jgi:hypothetical protein
MTLLSYARFYDSLNNMMPSDKPDDQLLDDDEALDRWYDGYVRAQAIKYGKKSDRSGFDVANIPQYGTT